MVFSVPPLSNFEIQNKNYAFLLSLLDHESDMHIRRKQENGFISMTSLLALCSAFETYIHTGFTSHS